MSARFQLMLPQLPETWMPLFPGITWKRVSPKPFSSGSGKKPIKDKPVPTAAITIAWAVVPVTPRPLPPGCARSLCTRNVPSAIASFSLNAISRRISRVLTLKAGSASVSTQAQHPSLPAPLPKMPSSTVSGTVNSTAVPSSVSLSYKVSSNAPCAGETYLSPFPAVFILCRCSPLVGLYLLA